MIDEKYTKLVLSGFIMLMITYAMTDLISRIFHLGAVQYVGLGYLLVVAYIIALNKIGWKMNFYYMENKKPKRKVEKDIYWRKINENI